MAALEDMHTLGVCHYVAGGLLKEIVECRSAAADLSNQDDVRWVPGS